MNTKRIDRQYENQTKAQWYERAAAVAKLAVASSAAMAAAEERDCEPQRWDEWRELDEAGRAEALDAAIAVIRAESAGDAEALLNLGDEHGTGFVMAARQFAHWLGLVEDLT